jgi:hypothetical protein
VLVTGADIRGWLPGDNLFDDAVLVPGDLPRGDYGLSLGLVDLSTHEPRIRLAIDGRDADGWYALGKIRIQ